jgi:pyruvate kinase
MDLFGPKIRTGNLPPRRSRKGKLKEGQILLNIGDEMVVNREEKLGTDMEIDEYGRIVSPAEISTTLPEVFDFVREGERIWFDDGKIGGIIEKVTPQQWHIRITQAHPEGSKLKGDKGINLPDSDLKLPPLTDYDLSTLPFIARHADLVGYSFVQRSEDVERLQEELDRLERSDMGIILKIETKHAFDELPNLIFQAMKGQAIGIMVARGDLAVELGWTRIAEVQEEISWLCEAAHIPLIWATQILENQAKTGLATRAEITDAAAAVNAECAMLNKGPYITKAVKTLRSIDRRMHAHYEKKMGSLRPLHVATHYFKHHKP